MLLIKIGWSYALSYREKAGGNEVSLYWQGDETAAHGHPFITVVTPFAFR